jgi:hypothetical protein
VTDNVEAQSKGRGDANPNAGVLLLTQEQNDGGLSIRKCGGFGHVDEATECG